MIFRHPRNAHSPISGFSLLELLITVGVLSILLVGLLQLLQSTGRAQRNIELGLDMTQFFSELTQAFAFKGACQRLLAPVAVAPAVPVAPQLVANGTKLFLYEINRVDTDPIKIRACGKDEPTCPREGYQKGQWTIEEIAVQDVQQIEGIPVDTNATYRMYAARVHVRATKDKKVSVGVSETSFDIYGTFQTQPAAAGAAEIQACYGGTDNLILAQYYCQKFGGTWNPLTTKCDGLSGNTYYRTAPLGCSGNGCQWDVMCDPGDEATGGGLRGGNKDMHGSYPILGATFATGWHCHMEDGGTCYVICKKR